MLILAVETSCDETACSIVKNGHVILSNVISSQEKIHARYCGVVPELASRSHLENVNIVIERACRKAGMGVNGIKDNISAIAYTRGPGLAGSLLVGQLAAQTLSFINRVPLVAVHHIEGHLSASLLEHPRLAPPYLGLIVSGGHTELIIVRSIGRYEYLGGTRDDAAGEAFDKVAKLLELPYPGGPVIDRLAAHGNARAVAFPRPHMKGTWDFSFSGLKTAVVNYVKKEGAKKRPPQALRDICASFQQAVIDTLIEKTFAAARHYGMNTIVLGGGVTSNSSLRSQFRARAKKERLGIFIPSPVLCTDNAAMIACIGYHKFKKTGGLNQTDTVKTDPGLPLGNW